MTNKRVGLYPGTFDPMTKGHLDIIKRAVKLCDKLVIGVSTNPSKDPMFTLAERVEMVKRETAVFSNGDSSRIEVATFETLLIHFARKVGAQMLIRGLRAVSDFEYEFQMAGMNAQLAPDIETVFLMAETALQPIASKLVKEIALFDGDITPFVSPQVALDVAARVKARKKK